MTHDFKIVDVPTLFNVDLGFGVVGIIWIIIASKFVTNPIMGNSRRTLSLLQNSISFLHFSKSLVGDTYLKAIETEILSAFRN